MSLLEIAGAIAIGVLAGCIVILLFYNSWRY